MKPIDKNELYANLTDFLKNKGIELKDGSYAKGIEKSCSLLTEAINLGQQSLERAKTQIDKKLDRVRQVIHEKTAPKSGPQKGTRIKVTASKPSGAKRPTRKKAPSSKK
jgi:hypothetical protein